MKSGIELITEERLEQIEKHGWTVDHDKEHDSGELKFTALHILGAPYTSRNIDCFWGETEDRITKNNTEIEKLIIAAALLAAEIDRLQNE